MVENNERDHLTATRTYHEREAEKALRKMRGWQERYQLHLKTAWDCQKRLIEADLVAEGLVDPIPQTVS